MAQGFQLIACSFFLLNGESSPVDVLDVERFVKSFRYSLMKRRNRQRPRISVLLVISQAAAGGSLGRVTHQKVLPDISVMDAVRQAESLFDPARRSTRSWRRLTPRRHVGYGVNEAWCGMLLKKSELVPCLRGARKVALGPLSRRTTQTTPSLIRTAASS